MRCARQRMSSTWTGRSIAAQARSAVSTAAGSLRTASARQQRVTQRKCRAAIEEAHRSRELSVLSQ